VNEYELTVKKSLSFRKPSIENSLKNSIILADQFIKDKELYLEQFKVDDDIIKTFNLQSKEIQSELNQKSEQLMHLNSDCKVVNFVTNDFKLNLSELGFLNFEQYIKKVF
jgi:hypothetical protein